jgi:alpha-glucosidase
MPEYSVKFLGTQVVLPSELGFGAGLHDGFHNMKVTTRQHHETWKPIYGERDTMPNNYREMDVELMQSDGVRMQIDIRAFDEGVAFRYSVPAGMETDEELTEFHFPANSSAFEEHGGTEGEYFHTPISGIKPLCHAPHTVTLPDGSYAAVLEAANMRFPVMTLGAEEGKPYTLIAALGGPAKLAPGAFTPWRLVMFAKTPAELLEHNYLVLDLNEKNALTDTLWIRPSKTMREVTLSTEGAKRTIDFAAAHHLQYVGFDWGWYGSEDLEKGDATRVQVDTRRSALPDRPTIQDSICLP